MVSYYAAEDAGSKVITLPPAAPASLWAVSEFGAHLKGAPRGAL